MRQATLAVRVVLLTLGMGLLTTLAHAQYRGAIQGVVTDPQGAVVSGATVSLKNLETGQTITDTSDAKGVYNFNALPPSKFTLTVEKDGFKKKEIANFGIVAEQGNAITQWYEDRQREYKLWLRQGEYRCGVVARDNGSTCRCESSDYIRRAQSQHHARYRKEYLSTNSAIGRLDGELSTLAARAPQKTQPECFRERCHR